MITLFIQTLDQVAQVYAARKGIKKGNMDMTFFVLIVRLHNDVRLKILETKNATKIRKELICVRKFLGLDDKELAIYDETRQKDGTKRDNRHVGVPLAQQLINSKGESLSEEFPDLIKEESKTATANNAALADAEFSEEDDHVDFKQD